MIVPPQWKVLITAPPMIQSAERCEPLLVKRGIDPVFTAVRQQHGEDELRELVADVDGVIAGDDPFTERVLAAGRKGRLRVVAKWGVGTDAIDKEAAARLGIRVSNTPRAFGDEVADVAVGYLVLLARRLHQIDASIRRGGWPKPQGISLRGLEAGIIGFGDIGRSLAERLTAHKLHVLCHDIRPIDEEPLRASGASQLPFEQVIEQSDVVFLCCNLSALNHHMMDSTAFDRMKSGAWLINVSRGGLVDQTALIAALDSGRLGGAALDVYENEPLPAGDPLLSREDVVLGSHNASNTRQAVDRVNARVIDNLLRDLQAGAIEGKTDERLG